MGKFYGVIGYATPVETSPGIWTDEITERTYTGDILKYPSKWTTSSDSVNDDLTLSGQFSVLADPFAYQNFSTIKYIEFMGTKWKVTNIDPQYPRLLLSVGGVYNGR